MVEKEHSLTDLKGEVTRLQEEIHRFEDKKQKSVKSLFRWERFSRWRTRSRPLTQRLCPTGV